RGSCAPARAPKFVQKIVGGSLVVTAKSAPRRAGRGYVPLWPNLQASLAPLNNEVAHEMDAGLLDDGRKRREVAADAVGVGERTGKGDGQAHPVVGGADVDRLVIHPIP